PLHDDVCQPGRVLAAGRPGGHRCGRAAGRAAGHRRHLHAAQRQQLRVRDGPGHRHVGGQRRRVRGRGRQHAPQPLHRVRLGQQPDPDHQLL
ncbi:hypothetical protein IWW55_004193, partial [Coemansia sp. RSA 2706]